MLPLRAPLPSGPWALEFKLDGVRAITYTTGGPSHGKPRSPIQALLGCW
jgi:hypothetical protein